MAVKHLVELTNPATLTAPRRSVNATVPHRLARSHSLR